jgi:ankyrin repeat protein
MLDLQAVESQSDENGETAALLAARLGDREMFSAVATNLDSLTARDAKGRTIAMTAAAHGHAAWFEPLQRASYLGNAGKDNVYVGEMVPFDLDQLSLTDSGGKTALQLAEENGHTEIADILRRHLQAIVAKSCAVKHGRPSARRKISTRVSTKRIVVIQTDWT